MEPRKATTHTEMQYFEDSQLRPMLPGGISRPACPSDVKSSNSSSCSMLLADTSTIRLLPTTKTQHQQSSHPSYTVYRPYKANLRKIRGLQGSQCFQSVRPYNETKSAVAKRSAARCFLETSQRDNNKTDSALQSIQLPMLSGSLTVTAVPTTRCCK